MRIDLSHQDIKRLAEAYDAESKYQDSDISNALRLARKRGYMTPQDLDTVARWKWRGGRVRRLCAENSNEDVAEVTAASFSAKSGRLRIGALLALRGVNWPMASVILHFAFPEDYPILDVRAMRTVGANSNYSFALWDEYSALCRDTARRYGIPLRTLDKALWQFDKNKQ